MDFRQSFHCIGLSQRLQLLRTPDDAYFEIDYLVYGLINYKQNENGVLGGTSKKVSRLGKLHS